MPNQSEKKIDPLIPEMVFVEGGSFQMKSNAYLREQPIHKVTIPDFLLGKYPVTNIQFAAFLNEYRSNTILDGPNKGKKMIDRHDWGLSLEEGVWKVANPGFEQHPIIYITWYGAVAYCEWLSAQTGKGYRLPSEAEWEYAARGGQDSQGFQYAGSNKLKEVGWYRNNGSRQTKPVGLKQSNELGLYDMSGNVWEWCADHWHDNYKGAPKDGSAWVEGGDSARRVVRGGSWYLSDDYCRVSFRNWDLTDYRDFGFGFRLARY